jgi:putative intracellular protease/amidase
VHAFIMSAIEAQLAAKDAEIERLRAENDQLKLQLESNASTTATAAAAPPPTPALSRNISESMRATMAIEEIRHSNNGKPRIGLLMFRGFEMLDVFGPLEMIGLLMRMQSIELLLVSAQGSSTDDLPLHVQADPTPDRLMGGKPPSSFGPFIKTDVSMEDCPELDVLLVPGGMGTRDIVGEKGEILNASVIDWIKKMASAAKLVLTICTGTVLVAATGLLDGKEATTNKMAYDWVTSTRPAVQWRRGSALILAVLTILCSHTHRTHHAVLSYCTHHAGPRWCEDGKWICSAGVSAGLDGVLHAISLMYSTLCTILTYALCTINGPMHY